MNADVLICVGRRNRRIQVIRDSDVIVLNERAVKGVRTARAVEHSDRKVEIKKAYIGNRPVLVVAAVKIEDTFKIHSRKVSRSLNRRGTEAWCGKRHAI